jgi:glycosyltransferase involved in cell wall biosynthesis
MKPAHILILTSGNLCRNPRPAKEAAALAAAGHTVAVLYPGENAANEAADAALAAGQGYTRRALPPRPSFWRSRLPRWLAYRALALGWQDARLLGEARRLWHAARATPADLTIAHNETGLWAGARLRATGRRVAADLEDWYSEDLIPSERRSRPLRLLRTLEGAHLRAGHCSTTSAALAAALAQAYHAPTPVVVPNVFPLQPDPRVGPPAVEPKLLWYSQTIGPGRGLEDFIAAWALIRTRTQLTLLGQERPGYLATLLAPLAPEKRARVNAHATVPPSQLPAVIAQHDVGLALETSAIPSRDLTITNKIFQYMNAGLAVIATPTAGQREVFATSPDIGLLLALGAPPESQARALDTLLGAPIRLAAAQCQARVAAKTRYNWELIAPTLVAHVNRALA